MPSHQEKINTYLAIPYFIQKIGTITYFDHFDVTFTTNVVNVTIL